MLMGTTNVMFMRSPHWEGIIIISSSSIIIIISSSSSSSSSSRSCHQSLMPCYRHVHSQVDIDNSELEKEFINQVIEMPEVASRVDELFWEHHVLQHPLSNTAGRAWRKREGEMETATDTLADSYRIFQELRRLGIKAHSWV